MHEAEVESTEGGRRWLLELVLKRRALNSRISDRRAAASICSEMEAASFWSLKDTGFYTYERLELDIHTKTISGLGKTSDCVP